MDLAHGGAAGLALEVLPLVVIPVLLVIALLRAGRKGADEDERLDDEEPTAGKGPRG